MPRSPDRSSPPPTAPRLAIGMMSGTSLDGVDAALIRVAGRGLAMHVEFLAHAHEPFHRRLRDRLAAVLAPATATIDELLALSTALCDVHIALARRLLTAERVPADHVAVVGVHGQTICHRPPLQTTRATSTARGSSWQLGQFAPLAHTLQVPVVFDFRAADLAVGGQGAPLVPWTDLALFGHGTRTRLIVNLGGVCNVTLLPPGHEPTAVVAGDIGPCNLLIDAIVQQRLGGGTLFDRDGRLTVSGQVSSELADALRRLVRTAVSRRRGVRSLGREQFDAAFVGRVMRLGEQATTADLLATAADVVARHIVDQLPALSAQTDIILAGGATRNVGLVERIRRHAGPCQIGLMNDFSSIPPEAKEAVSFAMLALANIDRVPANLPQVTGASRAVVLGAVVGQSSRP